MISSISKFKTAISALVLAVNIVGPSFGETSEGTGIFESQSDVGMPARQGDAAFDSETEEYRVTGSGKNM